MGDVMLQRIRNRLTGRQPVAMAGEAEEPVLAEGPDVPAPPASNSVPRPGADAGMSTVEYAVGTVVAAAFAAVLYKIVTGDSVIAGLTNLINTALNTSF